jgi:hypothetical protein
MWYLMLLLIGEPRGELYRIPDEMFDTLDDCMRSALTYTDDRIYAGTRCRPIRHVEITGSRKHT